MGDSWRIGMGDGRSVGADRKAEGMVKIGGRLFGVESMKFGAGPRWLIGQISY